MVLSSLSHSRRYNCCSSILIPRLNMHSLKVKLLILFYFTCYKSKTDTMEILCLMQRVIYCILVIINPLTPFTIDFGFLLDISPGGINFESAPFKLTTEMVQVLGGDINHPAYKLFNALCVKAYLSIRPYANEMVEMVSMMSGSSLPCFRGPTTLTKFKERFHLEKSESEAAEFMCEKVRQSHENKASVLYDQFQYIQNRIPY